MRASLHHRRQMTFEEAAIVQPGQGSNKRQFDRLLHLLAQTVGVALLRKWCARARAIRCDRPAALSQSLIAELEPAQHARAILEFGDDENGQVSRALERANLAAQAEAVVIGEAEADDEDVDIVLGRLEHGLLRIRPRRRLRDARQRLQEALGRTLAIVDEKKPPPRSAVAPSSAFAKGAIMPQRHRGIGAIAQFVDHHLETGERAHASDQGDFVDRLGDESRRRRPRGRARGRPADRAP